MKYFFIIVVFAILIFLLISSFRKKLYARNSNTEKNNMNLPKDQSDQNATYANIAIEFTRLLTNQNFDSASDMLTDKLKETCGPDELKRRYEKMISLDNGPPNSIKVIEQDSEPDKPKDLGWAYVAIEGEKYSQALSVTVCEDHGKQLIRCIEWGRI